MPILGIFASQITGKLFAPSGAYDSIATTTVGAGGAASITFSSIPSTYTHLQVRYIARDNRGIYVDFFKMRFNSDSGTNYAVHALYGDGSSALATATTSNSSIDINRIAASTAVANGFGAGVIDILDYANTNKYKTSRALAGYDDNGQGQIWFQSGLWQNTAAITQIDLLPGVGTSFTQYSSFALYGIKGS